MKRLLLMVLPLALIPTPAGAQTGPTAARQPSSVGPVVPRQLTLDRAEQILLESNLAIAAGRYGVDAARAQRLAASLRLNPTVTVSTQQFDLLNPFRHLLSDSGSAAQRAYTFQYDQIFERGNKRQLRTEAASLQVQAADAALLDTVRQQLFQLGQAFYSAVLARENARVAQETLVSGEDTERLIRLQVGVGRSPEWDLIKYQANKVQFQRDLVSAQLMYQQATRDLLRTIGAQSANVGGSYLEVMGDLNAEPAATLSVVDLRDNISARPDVVAAQKAVEASQKNLELARALRTRDVDMAWNYTRTGGDNTIGFSASVPLFIHNNHQAEIDLANAQLKQAQAQLNQTKLQAIADVEKAYEAYDVSQKLLKVYTADSLSRAAESLKIAQASYREGAASLLELQEAQRTYNQTRIAYNQARSDYVMSLYQLQLTAGKTIVAPQIARHDIDNMNEVTDPQ